MHNPKQISVFAPRQDVRFGSLADMCGASPHVRFATNSDRESGHLLRGMSALPLKANMCSALTDVRFGPIADMPLLSNATGSQELETKSYLSPAEDSLAVEELDHTGFDRGGLVVRDHHRGDDGVAVVVERNGKGGSP
jgi:hypothetical protein